jgi:CubicO group peptidase (beta-lactamase class C family)
MQRFLPISRLFTAHLSHYAMTPIRQTLLFALLLPLCLAAQTTTTPVRPADPADIERRIPELMEQANIPGLSLVVFRNQETIYSGAFGVRSVDTREPVTEQTVFSAASLSKPVFAYALLQLVQAGRFDLDRPLHQYLPYPRLEHDARRERITARQVLSHQSGLPNWQWNAPRLEFKFDPGERFGYSGEGFVYLMKVVEEVTGQDIETFMQETVFGPLGMTRSSYLLPQQLRDDYAFPHDEWGVSYRKYFPEEGNVAHSLQTTARDYSRFLQAVLAQRDLDAATTEAFLTPQIAVAEDHPAVSWGLGTGLQQTADGQAFWHWGDNGTFKAFYIVYPATGVGLVYFANSSLGLGITRELLEAGIGGTYPAVDWIDYWGPDFPAFRLAKDLIRHGNYPEVLAPYLDPSGQFQDTTRIDEGDMNELGYTLLRLGHPVAAETVLELNTRAYPRSANAFDRYGELLLRNGKREAALTAYREALALDAKNIRAASIVHHLDPANWPKGRVVFELPDYPHARSVRLAGPFNDWNELTLPLHWENGRWVIRLDLEPGEYPYYFVVDRVRTLDPDNSETTDTKGQVRSLRRVE